ncbi:MAG: tandem-95 repeat protein [Chloroflexaceae bacterium]|nr:tandem-95 repeat protein [Chloroflexaceae bacterium]
MNDRTFSQTVFRTCRFVVTALIITLLIGGTLLIGNPSAVYAATYTVDTTADGNDVDTSDGICATSGGQCTLRAAVQQANQTALIDDEITVPSGTYVLTLGDIVVEDAVVIRGVGATKPIINGNNGDRIFTVEGNYENQNTQITIMNLLLQNGNASGASYGNIGGAILNLAILNLENVEIRNNRAQEGGGIYHLGSDSYDFLTVTGSIISENTAAAEGGGVYIRGKARIENKADQSLITKIESNQASAGGGLFLLAGADVTLKGDATGLVTPLIVGRNTVSNSGGGIYNNATLKLEGVKVERNKANLKHGGGIFNDRGNLTVNHSDIYLNEAFTPFTDTWNGHQTVPNYWGTGGGIANFNGGNIIVTDTSIRTNKATTEGGGITNKGSGRMQLVRVTISNNEVTGAWLKYYSVNAKPPEVYGNGGAILSQSTGDTEIYDSRIIGNTAGHGGGAVDNTADLEIYDTLLDENTAGAHPDSKGGIGGAIYNYTGKLYIYRSVFRNNATNDSGGAIFSASGTATIDDSAFIGNKAKSQGGAFYNTARVRTDQWGSWYSWSPGVINLTNVTISGNIAGWRGGAILQNNENKPRAGTKNGIHLSNATIVDNRAYDYGGIANVFNENLDPWSGWDDSWIRNSIIADNLHRYIEGNSDLPGMVDKQCVSEGFPSAQPFTSNGYNIASDNSCSSWFTRSTDRNNTDPLLGTLEEQDGNNRLLFTQVYPLLVGSPAINPGSSNGATNNDQRGFSREGNRDIGAFEVRKPVVSNDNIGTPFQTPITIDLLANDNDPDDGTLDRTSVVITNPAQGTIVNHSDGTVTYTPPNGFTGTATMNYTVKDNHGHQSNSAQLQVVVSNASTPSAIGDSATTGHAAPVAIDVLANDAAPVGHTLITDTVEIRTGSGYGPNNGTIVSVNDSTGEITYRPNVGFGGIDTFQYRVRASNNNWSNYAQVSVTVAGNNPPITQEDTGTASTLRPLIIYVLANDSDPNPGDTLDPASVRITVQPQHGTAIVNPNGTIKYTPDLDQLGIKTLRYTVKDNHGLVSAETLVTINVVAGALPEAYDDTVNVLYEQPLSIDILGNDVEPDIDGILNPSSVLTGDDCDPDSGTDCVQPSHGTIEVQTDGRVLYTPNAGYSGPDTFQYTVANQNDLRSNMATVTINVSPKEDVLVAPASLSIDENGGTDTFTITLTAPPTVEVTLALTNTNVAACRMFTSSVTLDPSNWEDGVGVTVDAIDNIFANGDQSCTIQVGNASSVSARYNGLTPIPNQVDVTVIDEDTAAVVVSPTSLTLSEPDDTATFTVSLTSEPLADVTVAFTSTDTTECTVPANVTLTSANWQNGLPVTVSALNDDLADGPQSCLIETTISSAGSDYTGQDPADVNVTVQDDDSAGVVVSPTSLTLSEPSDTGSFTVALTSEPLAVVTIAMTSTDTTECTVPASITLTSANWSDGLNVTVSAVDDDFADGAQNCIIETAIISASSEYDGIDPNDVSVTVADDDTAGIVVAPTSLTVSEPDDTATFTVALTSEPLAAMTLALTSTDTTECTVPASITLTSANWTSGVSVTVTAQDDTVADGAQTCIIETAISSASSEYDGIEPDDVTVTVEDDEIATVVVSPTSLLVSEPATTASFTVTLTSEPVAAVTLALTTTDTTECTVPTSITLTSANWTSGVSVTVTAVDDDLADGSQSCTIETANAVSVDTPYHNVSVADVDVTVEDDDAATISVSPTMLLVSEPAVTAAFTIGLSTEPISDVMITLTTTDTTECAVADSVILNSANWEGVTVTVTAVDDNLADGSQTCVIVTSAADSAGTPYDGVSVEDVTVTVADDEIAAVIVDPTSLSISEPAGSDSFTIALANEPVADVTIVLTSTDTTACTIADSSVTLTSANWEDGVAVTVTAVNDDVVDGSQTCVIDTSVTSSITGTAYNALDVADVTVTVADDDAFGVEVSSTSLTVSEPATTDSFVVSLTSEPTADVTIALSSDDTSVCTVADSSITLESSNWADGVEVTVTAVDDNLADGTQTCVIATTVSSSDTDYDGLDAADVTVTVEDDDVAAVIVDPTELSISEPAGSDRFTIALANEPVAAVTIALSSSDPSACTIAEDSVTLDSSNWEDGVEVTVTAVDDDLVDGSQTCTIATSVTSSDADTAYDGLDVADVTVTVADDDGTGIAISPTSMTLSEPAGSDTVTIKLDSEPTSDVVVSFSTSTDECSVADSATLTSSNWADGVEVTVNAVDDDLADGSQTCVIATSVSSSDATYDGLDLADVTVTVEDDEVAAVSVEPTELSISEPAATGSFTIALVSEPVADVTIDLSSNDPSECSVTETSVTLTSSNWEDGVVVTVNAVDDTVVDGSRTCTIETGVTSSAADTPYDGLDVDDVTVTVEDDDVSAITLSVTELTLTENSSGTFQLTLESAPVGAVSFIVSSSNPDVCTVEPAEITLNADNWQDGVTVEVTAVDNESTDGSQTCTITIEPSPDNEGDFATITPAEVQVTVTDDEVAAIDVDITTIEITEGSNGSFTVVLLAQPADDVTVTLTPSSSDIDLGAGPGNPLVLTFTPENWHQAQTVTVVVVDNETLDGPRTSTITISTSGGGFDAVTETEITVKITDDEASNPAMAISLACDDRVAPGTSLACTAAFTNTGNVRINTVQVRQNNPVGIFNTTLQQNTLDEIVTTIEQLAPGENSTVNFTLQVQSTAPEGITNVSIRVLGTTETGEQVEAQTATPVLVQFFRSYLPVIQHIRPQLIAVGAPDLVAQVRLSPDSASLNAGDPVLVEVQVSNQGTAATESGFWVDLYLNPTDDAAVNTRWDSICPVDMCHGIAWQVADTLAPGESITLTSTPTSFAADHSIWFGWLPSGVTDMYVYVDSWQPGSATGSVDEGGGNETNNLVHLGGLQVTGENPAFTTVSETLPERTTP